MKKIFAVWALGILSFTVVAQNQDPNSPGFDLGTPTDSTVQTPAEGEITGEETAAPAEPLAKPYVRITLNVDSVTNLITYLGVVEQEESGSDSLYTRLKNWAAKRFEGGASKSLYEIDKKNQKVIINAWLPARAYTNKYTKANIGRYEFKMTVWIKEGRYKYQLSNFVHEGVKPNQGKPVRNYFEFYYTTTTNIKGSDQILRYADQDINKLIDDFKKHMKDPIIVDEEDW